MAPVKVETGPISPTSPIGEVPPERWRELLSKRRGYLAINLPSDCRYLLQFVREAEASEMWRQTGHADLEDLIARGLELKPQDVRWALDGLRSFKPTEAVPYEQAVSLGRWGGLTKTERENRDVSKHLQIGSTNASYQRARFERDDPKDAIPPDLKADVLAGRIKPGAAARRMGWSKPTSNLSRLKSAWRGATEGERDAFDEWRRGAE